MRMPASLFCALASSWHRCSSEMRTRPRCFSPRCASRCRRVGLGLRPTGLSAVGLGRQVLSDKRRLEGCAPSQPPPHAAFTCHVPLHLQGERASVRRSLPEGRRRRRGALQIPNPDSNHSLVWRGRILSEHFFDRFGEGADHATKLRAGGAVGRHQNDHVADRARQHTSPRHGFSDTQAGAFA